MRRTQWWWYVQRLMDARGWTPVDLARVSGVDLSVIGRWRSRESRPNPASVRAVARAFGRPVMEAVIAAGHYTAEELGAEPGVVDPDSVDLTLVPHNRLSEEVLRRMAREPARRTETVVRAAPLPAPTPRDEPVAHPPSSAPSSAPTGRTPERMLA